MHYLIHILSSFSLKEFKEQLEKDHLEELNMHKKLANDLRSKLDQVQKELEEKQVDFSFAPFNEQFFALPSLFSITLH